MKKIFKLFLRTLQVVFVFLLLVYVVSPLWKSASAFKDTFMTLKPLSLVAGIVILSLVIICYPFLWKFILGSLGYGIKSRTAVISWIYSNIGKYMPGKVWQFIGRTALTKKVKPEITLFTVFLEVAISFSAAVMVFFLRFMVVKNMPILWFIYAAFLFLILLLVQHPKVVSFVLRIFAKLRKQEFCVSSMKLSIKNSVMLFFAYFVLWVFTGFSFWIMIQGSKINVGLLDAVTTYPISWILGYLFLIAPAGLGVREGVLMSLLKGIYPETVASAYSVLTRIALVTSDFLLFFVIWLLNILKWKGEA
ncbi:MAG: lysylphosphatidylglycerol synthase domain-containing protein [candidate division WOR-3 bacterium]